MGIPVGVLRHLNIPQDIPRLGPYAQLTVLTRAYHWYYLSYYHYQPASLSSSITPAAPPPPAAS